MTMTDTEAKALALVNEATDSNSDDIEDFSRSGVLRALLLAIERLEATEARHAAELRELKERFSEATSLTLRMLTPYPLARYEAEDILTPFILPKPDPLFEAMKEVEPMTPWEPQDANELRAAIEKRGGKIVWGADQ